MYGSGPICRAKLDTFVCAVLRLLLVAAKSLSTTPRCFVKFLPA